MTAPPPADPMSGARKAAILMMALGEERSAEVFKHLQEHEIEALAREVAAINTVSTEVGVDVLDEFSQLTTAADHIANGGVDHARRLLVKSLGPDSARRILDRVTASSTATAGFASLEKANPQQLSKFILGEHPQTIAVILAHLNAASAAQLVTLLPDDLRADVLMRMASIDEILPEVIARISSVIDQRLKQLGGASREQHGGVKAVAELFNRMERGLSQRALETVEERSQDLAVQIRNLMFVFDDLASVEDTGIRELVNRADKKSLTIALKGASEAIRERFFSNMSKRAGELLKEEMDLMGAVRLREVEKAQQEIVAIARKLEDEGVITTGNAGEPYVV
ncbi:MAG: flagellar motor switch protein FliG [Vicinamibacterales bacterium]